MFESLDGARPPSSSPPSQRDTRRIPNLVVVVVVVVLVLLLDGVVVFTTSTIPIPVVTCSTNQKAGKKTTMTEPRDTSTGRENLVCWGKNQRQTGGSAHKISRRLLPHRLHVRTTAIKRTAVLAETIRDGV